MIVTALMLLGASAQGCYGVAQPAYVSAGVGFSPAYIDTYPSFFYGGRTVYLVNGRWWFHDRGRWSYYRREPATLYRQRMYIQQAPRARPSYRAPSTRAPSTRTPSTRAPAARPSTPRAPAPRRAPPAHRR